MSMTHTTQEVLSSMKPPRSLRMGSWNRFRKAETERRETHRRIRRQNVSSSKAEEREGRKERQGGLFCGVGGETEPV